MSDNTNHNEKGDIKDGIKSLIKLLLKYGATELYGNKRTSIEKSNHKNIKKFSVLNSSSNNKIKNFVRKQRPSFLSRFRLKR
jgi:hypothetical protein